jgi:hypothetical protein
VPYPSRDHGPCVLFAVAVDYPPQTEAQSGLPINGRQAALVVDAGKVAVLVTLSTFGCTEWISK